jgi:NADH-quinone oxidoreductase subunit C
MDSTYQLTASALQERFGAQTAEFRGEVTLTVPAERIVEVVTALRDEFAYNQLVDVTAVDYFPQQEPRFHIVYHLRALEAGRVLCLRAPVNGSLPQISTVEKVFPGANWFEREVFDMFGVIFNDHSDLRRVIMPYDWQGHPLRKDYPLGYEEVQYTFNIDTVSVRKNHPQD